MARKNILQGLMEAPKVAPATAEAVDHAPRSNRGAIGAVSRSIADLKARAVVELDSSLIDAGGLQDRLESDSAEEAGLRQSIAEYGQQVPVLVRPHPEEDGRYQIVYGRRRVLALKELGQPVKALIRDLDDRELVLAQGQENTARRDLSFIEKVNFARQMATAGYERKAICDALSVDKTLISRMLSVADRIPLEIIETIGAAPSIGRDRWVSLADHLEKTQAKDVLSAIEGETSDQRFQSLYDHLNRPAPKPMAEPKAAAEEIHDISGKSFAQIKRDKKFLTLKLTRAQTKGFEEWLSAELPLLLAQWQEQNPED